MENEKNIYNFETIKIFITIKQKNVLLEHSQKYVCSIFLIFISDIKKLLRHAAKGEKGWQQGKKRQLFLKVQKYNLTFSELFTIPKSVRSSLKTSETYRFLNFKESFIKTFFCCS